jgi:hypothetical protein
LTAFIVLFFYFTLINATKELKKSYDQETITPSDYTLYFYLEPSISQNFDSYKYDEDSH